MVQIFLFIYFCKQIWITVFMVIKIVYKDERYNKIF